MSATEWIPTWNEPRRVIDGAVVEGTWDWLIATHGAPPPDPTLVEALRVALAAKLPPAAAGPWLTRRQAAKRVGCSLRKFDDDVRGRLPQYRIGKSVRFKLEDIDEWLVTQKVGSSSAVAASTAYVSRTKAAATRSPRAREILKKLRG